MVVVVNKSLPQYRRPFFEALRTRLNDAGVDFRLVYGDPIGSDAARNDSVRIPWATRASNRVVKAFGRDLVYQPGVLRLHDVDLLVVEQASKLLTNYLLQMRRSLGRGPLLAFWGHGENRRRAAANWLAERVKRLLSTRVDWWFAYTEGTAELIEQRGFPRARISVVQNAIDTRAIAAVKAEISPAEVAQVRQRDGLLGENLCIFAGAMYEERRLPYLIAACDMVRARLPDFELVCVGSGPHASVIVEAARTRPWLKAVGPKFDREKAAYFALARLALMPGAVGLGILDTFAFEVPLVTCECDGHGPEIEYLQNGVNGVMLAPSASPRQFADTVTQLLIDPARVVMLKHGCAASAERLTLEAMVERFSDGVERALAGRC